jgi:hypothetical protein
LKYSFIIQVFILPRRVRRDSSETSRGKEEVKRVGLQNECSNIIGHGSHTKGRTCMGEIGKGRKPKT